MALIGVIALGLAAMRAGTPLAAGAAFNASLLAFLVSTLGAMVRRGEPAWVGFSLFGWTYLLMAFVPPLMVETPGLLTTQLVLGLAERLQPPRGTEPLPPIFKNKRALALNTPSMLRSPENFTRSSSIRLELTSAESIALDAYHAQLKAYQNATLRFSEQLNQAYRAGQSFFAIIFAAGGAILGRVIATQRRPTEE